MTVETTATEVNFAGNGTATTFAFEFKCFAKGDLAVTITDADDVVTTLTLDSDYSVALNADQNASPGGTVTYPISGDALASGNTLSIYLNMEFEQALDLPGVGGGFSPTAVENAFDRSVMLTKQVKAHADRALVIPRADDAVPAELPTAANRAGMFLAFDTNGDPVASSGTGADDGLRADLAASSGSSLVGFIQSGTGARTQTTQAKLRNELSITDFQNDDDSTPGTSSGVTDDITALRKAAVEQQALGVSVTSTNLSLAHGSFPTLHFPKGVYRISGDINNNLDINWKTFEGEDTILKMDAGVTAFTKIRYMAQFKGLQFFDGATALSIATGNVDTSTIDVEDCVFFGQATSAIKQDATSNSTLLTVRNSKFILPNSGTPYAYDGGSGDWSVFDGCWVKAGAAGSVPFKSTGVLNIKGGVGVPRSGMLAWVDNYNCVEINNFRLGGEAVNFPLVRNYATMDVSGTIVPSRVAIKNCPAYANNLIHFVELPNIVDIQDCHGALGGALGFTFDSGLDYTDFFNFQKFGQYIVRGNYVNGFADFPASSEVSTDGDFARNVFIASGMRNGCIPTAKRSRFRINEIVGSGQHGGGWSSSGTNRTTANVADAYAVTRLQITATADTAQHIQSLGTYLNQAVLTVGKLYTFITEAEAVGNASAVTIDIGGARKKFDVPVGKSILCIPFVYCNGTGAASTTYDTLSFTVELRRNGDVTYLGRHMVVAGGVSYDSAVLDIEYTGTPIAFTNGIGYNTGYFRGDRCHYTNVTASSFEGEVCTVQGAPGTWKTTSATSA